MITLSCLVGLVALTAPPIIELPSLQNNEVNVPMRLRDATPPTASDPGDAFQVTVRSPLAERVLPAQTSKQFPGELFFILPPQWENEMRLADRLGLTDAPAIPGSPLIVEDDGEEKFWVRDADGPVLAYNYGIQKRDDIAEDRWRACYIHPIFGLDGETMTDDFPADHVHHRGLFWAWPEIQYDGGRYDIWHLRGIRPRFEGLRYNESGPVCALLGLQVGWYIGDNRVVDEKVDLTVWRKGEIGRALDVVIQLRATQNTVIIGGQGDRGYGGFNLRYAPRTDHAVSTPMGRHQRDGMRVEYPWADYSARFDGANRISGMSIFPNPLNPDYPPEWLLRNYGIFSMAWPSVGEYAIEPDGPPLVLRFRVWTHRGDVDEGKVNEAWQVYLDPTPETDVIAASE